MASLSPLDALPPAALLLLNLGVLAALGRRLPELPHARTAAVCLVAPAVYGLGAVAYVLGGRWAPGLAIASAGVLAIPVGVLLTLYPSRRALAGLMGLASLAWAARWWPWPRELRTWDPTEVGVGFYLAVATALAMLGLWRGRARGGIERRVLAVAALPSFAVGLGYVLLKARLSRFPVVSSSILVGGELVLLLLVRERPAERVQPSRAWALVLQGLLLGIAAALLLGLAVDVGLFPRAPAPFLLAVGLATAMALAHGLLRPSLEEALGQAFYPEEHRAQQRFRALAAELEDARERLRAAEHLSLVGQLAAEVAHEIKNPLGPIRGYARVIERELERAGVASERAARGLAVIREEVEAIDARARRLLELARPPRPEVREADLAEVVQDAIDLLAAEAPAAVTLGWRAPPPVAVGRLDPALLRSALVNVVQNALQALGPGPGRILFELTRDGDGWRLTIDDDGPGLPAGDPEELFRPFVSGRDGGHGLGLLIARGGVQALGGRLTLEPGPEGGARAILGLPLGGADGTSLDPAP